MYDVNLNYIEIVSGTSDVYSKAYTEAANSIDVNTDKGVKILTNFLTSIESLNSKDSVKDTRISSSKGNIKKFSAYDDVSTAINFLSKNFNDAKDVKDCIKLYDALEKYAPQYGDCYDKKVRLGILEYENALYLLVTALSSIVANRMEVVTDGAEIRIKKNGVNRASVIEKTLDGMASTLSDRNHKEYLEALIKEVYNVEPTPLKEDAIGVVTTAIAGVRDTIGMVVNALKTGGSVAKKGFSIFKAVKSTLFGVIPLIRSVLYLRYKKKADTIGSLETQVAFITKNIERLQNVQGMDPAKKEQIIKKQKAICEQYMKKAAKLRAQLTETEKEASEEIKQNDKNIGNTDDDFVLESGDKLADFFTEATKAKKNVNKSAAQIRATRDALVERKKPNKAGKSIVDPKIQSIIETSCKEVREKNVRKSVRLIPGSGSKSDADMKKRTDTKIGGIPYWPKNKLNEWPQYAGRNMYCLAQLNMDKLPHIDNYPSTGLLQFFVVDDESWDDEKRCKVVYWKTYKDEASVDVPDDVFQRAAIKGEWPPIEEVYYPTAKLEDDYPNVEGCGGIDVFNEITAAVAKKLNKDWKTTKDIGDESIKRCIIDTVWDVFLSSWGCRLAGYPSYTQSEPGYVDKDTINLLQLDSEAGMMWGDSGIAHFFIQKDYLKSLNFKDKVIFTWDCC